MQYQNNLTRRQRGFTLVELLITLVIIGILAAVGYPAYRSYVQDSRRADATSELSKVSQALERCWTQNQSYLDPADDDKLCVDLSNMETEDGAYEINATNKGTNTYKLVAQPNGAGQKEDPCGELTLTETGARAVSGADTGYGVEDCW